MPKVSVLMPVYKTKEVYLREAIESILAQTFEDFEFLILDDCPEDDREQIVKSYKDKRIKYFKNERNLGITPSRNKLIDMAEGEYLAVFDHDDISLPKRFAKEVAYLDEHPDVGVVSCWYRRIPSNELIKNPVNNKEIEICLLDNCFLLHPACMIRKLVLASNNVKYDEKYTPAEDYALFGSLIGKTKFHNLSEVLFVYRKHEDNTSKIYADKINLARDAIRLKLAESNPNLLAQTKEQNYIVRMRLFGIIPLGKFTKKGSNKPLLLKLMPFIQTKVKINKCFNKSLF